MRILGITGGIATGKSTVTQMLADCGAPTVSADTIARALLAPAAPTTAAVLKAFPACADASNPQAINRRALAQTIFSNENARRRLEALTHPPIIEALRMQFAEWRGANSAPAAAAEIPLLFEAHLEGEVDCIIVAACAEAVQVSRLRARDGIEDAEAHRQVAAQWPLGEKIDQADYIITTDGGLDDMRTQVQTFWESL